MAPDLNLIYIRYNISIHISNFRHTDKAFFRVSRRSFVHQSLIGLLINFLLYEEMNEVEMTAGRWYFQRAKLDAKEE